jgi:hypothetical protein
MTSSSTTHTLYDPVTGTALPFRSLKVKGPMDAWASWKFLGGNLGFMIVQPTGANGSLTVTQFGLGGGGYGFTDTLVQPFGLGWHLKRADIQVGDGFMIPTGRYAPGATNNIGSGYFGNHFMTGTTV